MVPHMTDSSSDRPQARPRPAAALLLGATVLVGAVAIAWASAGVGTRLEADGSVVYTGTFPPTPSGPATVFRVEGAVVDVTREALVEHFGFPADRVYSRAAGDGGVEYRTWAAGEAPRSPSSRFTVTPASGGPVPLLQFHHDTRARLDASTPPTGPVPEPVRAGAERRVRDALAALGLVGSDWSVTARSAYGSSGQLGVLVRQVVGTAHGPLPVGAAAAGWAVADRDGRLVGLSVGPATFTEAGQVALMSAEEAWTRYTHHRSDDAPAGDRTVFTDVELGMAVFVAGDRASVEALARPAWVFTTEGFPSLVLSADASAPGRVGEIAVPGRTP